MDAKQWLERARYAEIEIKELTELKDRIMASLQGGSLNIEGERVQTSVDNHTEKMLAEYADTVRMINVQIAEREIARKEILKAVATIEDERVRILLILRYLKNKTWGEIAEELHYSQQHVIANLHRKALREIKEYIKVYRIL